MIKRMFVVKRYKSTQIQREGENLLHFNGGTTLLPTLLLLLFLSCTSFLLWRVWRWTYIVCSLRRMSWSHLHNCFTKVIGPSTEAQKAQLSKQPSKPVDDTQAALMFYWETERKRGKKTKVEARERKRKKEELQKRKTHWNTDAHTACSS